MTLFIMKICGTLALSGAVWAIMMNLQKKKQADADYSFEMKLKSMGMSLEVQNDSQIPKK